MPESECVVKRKVLPNVQKLDKTPAPMTDVLKSIFYMDDGQLCLSCNIFADYTQHRHGLRFFLTSEKDDKLSSNARLYLPLHDEISSFERSQESRQQEKYYENLIV